MVCVHDHPQETPVSCVLNPWGLRAFQQHTRLATWIWKPKKLPPGLLGISSPDDVKPWSCILQLVGRQLFHLQETAMLCILQILGWSQNWRSLPKDSEKNEDAESFIRNKPHKYLGVSEDRGTPKSSILIGFSIVNHPFWGIPIFGNTHLVQGINFQAFWSNLPAWKLLWSSTTLAYASPGVRGSYTRILNMFLRTMGTQNLHFSGFWGPRVHIIYIYMYT